MNVHLLALPNVQTTMAYDLDGFNMMGMRFAKILKQLGYYVTLYASEENEYPCDSLVTCITKQEQKEIIGQFEYQHANIDARNPLWILGNVKMALEIEKRKQPRDMILSIGGGSQMSISETNSDLMTVEYSIGYVGNFAPYRVFQSHIWRYMCYGHQHMDSVRMYDEVIPGFFEVDTFPEETPEDYVCYVGRFIPRKGMSIVCDTAKAAGVPLKLVGHGDASAITYGENLGALHTAERNAVMAKAKALICPTMYIEPFGCISPEAQLCGTPVICTDAGGFIESVEQGKTGYRCSMFGEFVDAVKKVETLDRRYIRERARRLYSMETATEAYRCYFQKLNTLWSKGYHTMPYDLRS